MTTPRKINGGFERHAQSVIQVVMAASIIWGVTELVSMGKSIARLEIQTAQYTLEIASLKNEMSSMRVQLANATNVAANAASAAAATAAAVAVSQSGKRP